MWVLRVKEMMRGGLCLRNLKETGARWRSQMTARVESMKTLWLSRRGSSDRSINIQMSAFQPLLQHLSVFPFITKLIFLLMLHWLYGETLSTVENTNQNYFEDSVVTTEGNAYGSWKTGLFTALFDKCLCKQKNLQILERPRSTCGIVLVSY